MRSIIVPVSAALLLVATNAFAVNGVPVPPPATPPTNAGWWYPDKDADGYCATDGAVNQTVRPKGMKSKAECATDWDTDDTNKFVSPGAPVVTPIDASVKAAWTIGLTPAQADPASPVFVKARDQIEACEGLGHTWIVFRGTCNCTEKESAADSQFGVGFVWRIYRNDQTHKWEGTCDAIHGGAGSGSGTYYGVSAKRFEAQVAADDSARAGFRARDLELQASIDANGDADRDAWAAYQVQRDADAAADLKLRNELAETEAAQDREIKGTKATATEAKATADGAKSSIDTHTARHIEGQVGVSIVGGAQTPVVNADNEELRPGFFVGPALVLGLRGHPFNSGFTAGVEVVGVWLPGERGTRLVVGPTLGYDIGRLSLAATAGGWTGNTEMIGRETSVVAYGYHGGARVSFDLDPGVAITGGLTIGSGLRSVLANRVQDVGPSGFTTGQIGFSFNI